MFYFSPVEINVQLHGGLKKTIEKFPIINMYGILIS